MRCNHDYLMADFSFYMRLPCHLAETLHKSSSSWAVAIFRSVFRDLTCCCMGSSRPENISLCYFDDLAGAVRRSCERDSDVKYSTVQREKTVSYCFFRRK